LGSTANPGGLINGRRVYQMLAARFNFEVFTEARDVYNGE
jgi:hypothetical protein